MMEPIVTQCEHRALQSGCGLCKDARIAELETELTLRGEAIAVLNKALADDSQIVAQWQAQCVAAQEQIKTLREALENPSGQTHCCFCGTYNVGDTIGYAGERVCHACGHGGQGEADLQQMASKAWNNRHAALDSTAPVAGQKERE